MSLVRASNDGLVRLTLEQLHSLPLQHLLSGIDNEVEGKVRCVAAQVTELSGYTEWFYENGGAVTLGWDWRWYSEIGIMRCEARGVPRSNIQLREDGYDVSPKRNDQLLMGFISQLCWIKRTLNTVCGNQGLGDVLPFDCYPQSD
ncbi:DUF4902 domain-containing protein [Aliagarivorans marinus]|uniref:DUF4902 domain-containing protein n=1 Tax=Aliagarivorans marinus TaxID=561965 RepID=UPI00146FC1EB|nr:DUF4902 domain-containing protein [Aliagarivorans marinus]